MRAQREQWKLSLDGKQPRDSAWWRHWDAGNVTNVNLSAAILRNNGRSAAELLPEYFEGRKAPAFYWPHGERDKIVTTLKRCFPGRAERILQGADALCAHRFSIFAYPEISCGTQIPWRRDLVHDVESQLGHHSRLAPLIMEKTGDSKIVWELNRHQHFFTLSTAYLLTGNEKYADECLAQWEDWNEKNPYLQGINWASSLEVAFRTWSWSWTLFLLLGSRALTGEQIGKITQALSRSATFIAENLSTYFAPNTHLLG
ncbi:MAG: heparinase II/III family protein, partial [Candidatus Acidiferrales bacterium]